MGWLVTIVNGIIIGLVIALIIWLISLLKKKLKKIFNFIKSLSKEHFFAFVACLIGLLFIFFAIVTRDSPQEYGVINGKIYGVDIKCDANYNCLWDFGNPTIYGYLLSNPRVNKKITIILDYVSNTDNMIIFNYGFGEEKMNILGNQNKISLVENFDTNQYFIQENGSIDKLLKFFDVMIGTRYIKLNFEKPIKIRGYTIKQESTKITTRLVLAIIGVFYLIFGIIRMIYTKRKSLKNKKRGKK